MTEKRKLEDSSGALVKRAKLDDGATKAKNDMEVAVSNRTSGALIQQVKRTSKLKSPVMMLTGHAGEVLACKFSPDGNHLASSSFDKTIFLWNVYGDCENYMVLKGHTGVVLDCAWSRDGSHLFSGASDKKGILWDLETGSVVRKYRGHTGIVNSVSPLMRGQDLFATGSDDGTARLWDSRSKNAVAVFTNKYQVTTVAFAQTGDQIFSGSIDNDIIAWDIRSKSPAYTMKGHEDTVTGLAVSPDGTRLLSAGMDSTVRIWDIKPYAPGGRLLSVYLGAPHGHEKNLIRPAWSHDMRFIASGSSDRTVCVWDAKTGKVEYKLPGHKGCVNEVSFHPNEPIIASAGSDKVIYLGELDPSYS